MVELQHGAEPPELAAFLQAHPSATVADFDSPAFGPVKQAVKHALHRDQAGLCVYCERELASTGGQVDHVLPKGGTSAYPQLCFSYGNYAHSCIHPKTCGQRKRHGLLPILPGPGCNQEWSLSTLTGELEPVAGLTRQRQHAVKQTRDMLGLNKDAALVKDRKEWLEKAMQIAQTDPQAVAVFLAQSPFRYVLATVV